jgi:hypothetical protein
MGFLMLNRYQVCPLLKKCPTYKANQCNGAYCLHLDEIPVFKKRSMER